MLKLIYRGCESKQSQILIDVLNDFLMVNGDISDMTQKPSVNLTLSISSHGALYLDQTPDAQNENLQTAEQIKTLFADNYHTGLLKLGLLNFSDDLSPSLDFWQKFVQKFITAVCHTANYNAHSVIPTPSSEELHEIIMQAPFMNGYMHLNEELLTTIWQELNNTLIQELQHFSGDLKSLLNSYNTSWNSVGRVCFHLAENKNNIELPFAFLATYTTQLSHDQALKHVPLGRALEEYAGEKNRSALLTLLLPVQKAAEQSLFIKELIDSGDVFQPHAWNAQQAYNFLKIIPLLESTGVIIRVPNWWNTKNPTRPQVNISLGENKSESLGFTSMLDFNVHYTLSDGQELTEAEWQEILNAQASLIKVKGQWVTVDPEKIGKVLKDWQKIQQKIKKEGISFSQSMRILAGTSPNEWQEEGLADDHISWTHVQAGDWFKKTLDSIRNPSEKSDKKVEATLKKYLHAQLRPYQIKGVNWLWLLYQLQLGGCLADDMGLGKTIQVIALLLLAKHLKIAKKPHLLIVPASLLGNWQAEINRFAPTLSVKFLHPAYDSTIKENISQIFSDYDLIVTTYSFIHRIKDFNDLTWDMIVLDEAQTIKNPNTKQTIATKQLKSNVRFILTGTPIENRLSDLWSLFDFCAPGLLGSLKEFSGYSKKVMSDNNHNNSKFYSSIRTLISPYILRRLKTDKKIISDLPDKTEVSTYCSFSKEQIALYTQAVQELQNRLEDSQGIERKGLIFSYLMRLKQICNHPNQWLGYGQYKEAESGKFLQIKELCQNIYLNQEKVLIFTQFQEIIAPLADHLNTIFTKKGFILHGNTPIHKRAEIVHEFTQQQGAAYFILSLKAGGTGLNLTAASHVIHFDRWWNPAIENQATDRAFRIGQKKMSWCTSLFAKAPLKKRLMRLLIPKRISLILY